MLSASEITELLAVRGDDQERLFARARACRRAAHGDNVYVRGVTEVTNVCTVNCDYCPMRKDNTADNDIYWLSTDELVAAAGAVRASGINVVLFQAGEAGRTTRVVGEALPRIRALFGDDVEIMLNLGNKSRDDYAYLRDQGATTYILKHESANPEINQRMRHESLESRLRCMTDLLELGYRVGTGGIVGLPGQTLVDIADDIVLARDMGVHMCSFTPFVPAARTPLEGHPPGDVDVTLNAVAASRIVAPHWLIPSVSALEKTATGGQGRGYAAGANVLTINFTPDKNLDQYLIYGEQRFVVRGDYAARLLADTGLTASRSPYTVAARAA